MIANAINKELDDSMEFNYGRSGNDAKRKEKEIGNTCNSWRNNTGRVLVYLQD